MDIDIYILMMCGMICQWISISKNVYKLSSHLKFKKCDSLYTTRSIKFILNHKIYQFQMKRIPVSVMHAYEAQ